MNIHFIRDGTKAIAKVTLAIPNYDERVFSMTFECGSEVYAGLLVDAMDSALNKELRDIRQNEYETGWSDKASKKRPKQGWFSSTFRWRNRRTH